MKETIKQAVEEYENAVIGLEITFAVVKHSACPAFVGLDSPPLQYDRRTVVPLFV